MGIVIEYLLETIAGTTVMTAFSHLVSASFNKLFTEPVLLNYVLRISDIRIKPAYSGFIGWLLHYLAGLLFVAGFHWAWHLDIVAEDWVSGLTLGAASGIIGILTWMVIFRLPRKTPRVAFSEYYLQLFFAHVFFAFPVVAVHKLFAQASL